MDRTDIPDILAVSVPKSFSRHINMTATERVGLAPFTRKPLFASHILSTRGSRLAEACKEHVNGKKIQFLLESEGLEQASDELLSMLGGNKFSSGKMWKYAATSGPGLAIRKAFANHVARKAAAVEGKKAAAAAKKAASKGKKKKRVTRTQPASASGASGSGGGDGGGGEGGSGAEQGGGDDEEHEYQYATNRDEPPELDDGECIVDKKVVEECLALPEWYSEIENIATQMAMHFGEAGWYLGDQLKKGTAKDNKPGLYVVYEHESKPQGDPEVHTALDLASYGSKWFLIADVE